MNDDGHKPGWPWVVAVSVVLLPFLYVAMFGLAVCLDHVLDDRPNWLAAWIQAPDPMDWLIGVTPQPQSSELVYWYYNVYLEWWRDVGRSVAASRTGGG